MQTQGYTGSKEFPPPGRVIGRAEGTTFFPKKEVEDGFATSQDIKKKKRKGLAGEVQFGGKPPITFPL